MLLGTAAAHAATMTTATQTITFGPGLTDFEDASKNLNLFDSRVGTLLSVTIGATYGFNSTLAITNGAATASRGNVRTESAAGFGSSVTGINSVIQNLIDSLGSLTVGGTTIDDAAFDVLGTRATYSLASGQTTNANSNASTVTIAPVTDSTAADLQAFQAAGGGVFDVLFNTATGTILSNTGGNTGATEVTNAIGTLNIYYTYDPTTVPPPPSQVPEPGSMALFGTALLGIGMLRRPRR
jgi:hypothetical protein